MLAEPLSVKQVRENNVFLYDKFIDMQSVQQFCNNSDTCMFFQLNKLSIAYFVPSKTELSKN